MVPTAHGLLRPSGHLLKPEHEAAVDAILAGGESGGSEQGGGWAGAGGVEVGRKVGAETAIVRGVAREGWQMGARKRALRK